MPRAGNQRPGASGRSRRDPGRAAKQSRRVVKSISGWLNHKGAPCYAKKYNLGFLTEACEQRLFESLAASASAQAELARAAGDFELEVACGDVAGDAAALTETPEVLTVEALDGLLVVPEGATVGKNIATPADPRCSGSLAQLARLLESRGATLLAPAAARPARGRRPRDAAAAPAPAAGPAAAAASGVLRALADAATGWLVRETYRKDGAVQHLGARVAFAFRDEEGDDKAPLPAALGRWGRVAGDGDTDPPDGGGGTRGRGGSVTTARVAAAPLKTPGTVRRTPREADAAAAPAAGRASDLPAGPPAAPAAPTATPRSANTPARPEARGAPCAPLDLAVVESREGFEQYPGALANDSDSDVDDDAVVPRYEATLSPFAPGRKRPRDAWGDDPWGRAPGFAFFAAAEPVTNFSEFHDAAGPAPRKSFPGADLDALGLGPSPLGKRTRHGDFLGAQFRDEAGQAQNLTNRGLTEAILRELEGLGGQDDVWADFEACLKSFGQHDTGDLGTGATPARAAACDAGAADDVLATPEVVGVEAGVECYSGRSSPVEGVVEPRTEAVRAGADAALAADTFPAALRSRRTSFSGHTEDAFGLFPDPYSHCD